MHKVAIQLHKVHTHVYYIAVTLKAIKKCSTI